MGTQFKFLNGNPVEGELKSPRIPQARSKVPSVRTALLAGTVYPLAFIISPGRRLLQSRSWGACGRGAWMPLWQLSELPANLTEGTSIHIHMRTCIYIYIYNMCIHIHMFTFMSHIEVMSRIYIRNGLEPVLIKRSQQIREPCLRGHPVAFLWSLAEKNLELVSTAWTPKVGKIMAHQTEVRTVDWGGYLVLVTGLCHL